MMTDWLKNVPMGRGNLSSVTAVQNLSTNWKNTTSRIVPLEDLKQYQRTCKMIPLDWLNFTKLNAQNYNLRCIAYSGEVKGLSVNSSACLNKRSNCSDWRACQHRKKLFTNESLVALKTVYKNLLTSYFLWALIFANLIQWRKIFRNAIFYYLYPKFFSEGT